MRPLVSLLFVTTLLFAQDYDHARSLVQRVQDDLQRLLDKKTRSGKERERIENARKHLSDFDRNLRNNKFERDRLDEAIDDMKNVGNSNTLEPIDRDNIAADLRDLRELRSREGR